ncbi:IS200/IS605 family transposase [Kibdelosporangium aridum]|uniref:IS200/IS605 family transposase n=1 Tax=Kibdelosporangium aridum TaxID=2030 RepID=A0A428YVD6_KIBAR|nr:IS200/IS605 family transposase [Kibdelosporangium aridum]RSM73682.1 IS200/IS605 family transposase [Kibdelosporangium aridum]
MSPRWEPDPDIRRGRSVIYNLHVHLVFVTKYRRGAFTDQILTRCERIMRDVCGGFGAQLREFNGETDHVHLLVHYPPSLALSTLVNSLKGVSSRRLRQEFPTHIRRYLWGQHFWSPSYFAGSCGGAPLSIIKDYIEQQNRPD